MYQLNDFPPGPLDLYRKKASFDWKKMKLFLNGEDGIKREKEGLTTLQTHFMHLRSDDSQSLLEQRNKNKKAISLIPNHPILRDTWQINTDINSSPVLQHLDGFSHSAVHSLIIPTGLSATTLRDQGQEHHQKLLQEMEKCKIFTAFCMTEIGHGSNAKSLRTEATYDKEKQEFILHTPDFQAAKCWSGGLAELATHAIVFAQLYIEKKCYGVHSFIIEIRDSQTMEPSPGLILGDMGRKNGFNGVDNGFLVFNKFRTPKHSLLGKGIEITDDGRYISKLGRKERLATIFGSLSNTRFKVATGAILQGATALTIAVRYAAVRKQFGPEGTEVPILEYQTHQFRLLPYLAAIYVFRNSVESLYGKVCQATDPPHEFKFISGGCKFLITWLMRDCIQECREACGGYGYLTVSGLGNIKNSIDVFSTFAGDNHLLFQQTSNYLLKVWPLTTREFKIRSPFKSLDFLADGANILKSTFTGQGIDDICKPQTILHAYRWLVCYLLHETRLKWFDLLAKEEAFWTKSKIQIYYAKNIAIAFTQHFFLQYFLDTLYKASESNIREVLKKLFSLYGLWSLEKFLATFYEGGYTQGPQFSKLIHEAILKLCTEIKDDAVSLIDALAPADCFLNSVLGNSDGEVYKHLELALMSDLKCKPHWWKETPLKLKL